MESSAAHQNQIMQFINMLLIWNIFFISYPPLPLKIHSSYYVFTSLFHISQLLEIYSFMLNYVPQNKNSYRLENFRTLFRWIMFKKRGSVQNQLSQIIKKHSVQKYVFIVTVKENTYKTNMYCGITKHTVTRQLLGT